MLRRNIIVSQCKTMRHCNMLRKSASKARLSRGRQSNNSCDRQSIAGHVADVVRATVIRTIDIAAAAPPPQGRKFPLSRGRRSWPDILPRPFPRRESVAVDVGGVIVGGGAPVVVQSMTNTDTADIDQTVAQVAALHRAGSEIVRITVDRDESAAAVPGIRERLDRLGIDVPLVGDFHYIGHKLLADHPACAEALAKYRINPGNVGFKEKKDRQFARDRRDGDPLRQAGAHRRQLGLARPGTADPADGREPEARARR